MRYSPSLQWAICLTVLLSVAGFSMPAPVLTPLFLDTEKELFTALQGLDQVARVWWLGAVILLYPIGQLFGAPLFGRYSDKVGRKQILQFTLMGVAIGYLGMVVAIHTGNLWLLVISRLGAGFFNSNVAIAQAIAADISTPESKPRLFARINMALNLGWIIGPLSGGYAAYAWNDYSLPFVFGMSLALVNMLMITLWLPGIKPNAEQRQQAQARHLQTSRWALLKDAKLAPLFALTLFSYLAISMYFSYFNVYTVDVFDFGPREIAWSAVCISIPMMFGSWIGARLKARMKTSNLGMVGHGLMAAGMLTLPLMDTLEGFALTLLFTGVGMTISELATSLVVSNEASEAQQGEAMGMYRSVSMGSELAAVALGSVLIMVGVHWVFLAAGTFAAVAGYGFRMRRQAVARAKLSVA